MLRPQRAQVNDASAGRSYHPDGQYLVHGCNLSKVPCDGERAFPDQRVHS